MRKLLEQTELELFDDNIVIYHDKKSPLKSTAIKRERVIMINQGMIEGIQELRTILIHEQEHFNSNLFYTVETGQRRVKYRETRINNRVIKRILPLKTLLSMLKRFEFVSEIAEELCVTEELVIQAYEFYKEQGLIPQGEE